MGKPRLNSLSEVDFICQDCGNKFTAAPALVEDNPDQDYHPFYYQHPCTAPDCPNPACEQDPRQRGRLKAYANATGPRTEEGRARSAANLEGHPTPDEAKITRMNSIKHGAYARTLNYFPARPGKYATCDVCDYYGDTCVEDPESYHQNPKACLKRAELFVRTHAAFDSGDTSLLIGDRADVQAGLQAIINEMILQIAQDGGPRIKEMVWYYDKEGEFHRARYRDEKTNEWVQVYENKAHPLLKPLIDFVSKNSMTLSDMGMTPKVQNESELLAGHLHDRSQNEQDALEFKERQQLQLEKLAEMINNSNKNADKDPVLIEYNQGAKSG